jgi:phage terminase large subunit-like protein
VADIVTAGAMRAGRVRAFLHKHVFIADGPKIGQNVELLPEQTRFINDLYGRLKPDGRLQTRTAILSCARKNGKTAFISGLLQAHVFGPEAKPNSQVYSAARSRDQAALTYKYAAQSIRMNRRLESIVRLSDTNKTIHGLLTGAVYKALAADATNAYGLNPALTIHDELGQVVGPTDPFFDALETASGAQVEPLGIIISTQAPTDADLLSTIIDDAIASGDPSVLVHLYAAAQTDDILDPETWRKANFALGVFRSVDEIRAAAMQAQRMPSNEARFRNLYLNQRISLLATFLTPNVWKENDGTAPDEWFREYPVSLGLDLSTRTDLTAAVLSVRDPDSGCVGLRTFAYTPMVGLEERAKKDRAPYHLWVKQGHLIATPGRVVDYEFVIEHLKSETQGMRLEIVNYDRWRIETIKQHAERLEFADGAEWRPVGQGYKDMSPCLETFEMLAIDNKLLHGGNPVLTSAAMGSAAVQDPAGNRKLEKSKSSTRIDALVAAVMAVHGVMSVPQESADYDMSFF